MKKKNIRDKILKIVYIALLVILFGFIVSIILKTMPYSQHA